MVYIGMGFRASWGYRGGLFIGAQKGLKAPECIASGFGVAVKGLTWLSRLTKYRGSCRMPLGLSPSVILGLGSR